MIAKLPQILRFPKRLQLAKLQYLAQLCNIPRLHSISAWQSAIALVVCTQLETQLFILRNRNINHYNLWRLHVTTECFVDYRIHSKHFVTLCAANVLWLVAIIGTRMKKRNEGRLGGRILEWLNFHSFINWGFAFKIQHIVTCPYNASLSLILHHVKIKKM